MPGGRPKKPTVLKELGGTSQPCRTNDLEPVPEVALPLAPECLSDLAKEYWRQIGGVLLNMKIVTVADGPAMMLLCDTLAEWAEAREFVRLNGLTYETMTKMGDTMHRAYPQVAMASDAWRRAMSMLVQFGLTPSSRSKVSALAVEEPKDPFAAMMEDMKG